MIPTNARLIARSPLIAVVTFSDVGKQRLIEFRVLADSVEFFIGITDVLAGSLISQ